MDTEAGYGGSDADTGMRDGVWQRSKNTPIGGCLTRSSCLFSRELLMKSGLKTEMLHFSLAQRAIDQSKRGSALVQKSETLSYLAHRFFCTLRLSYAAPSMGCLKSLRGTRRMDGFAFVC